MSYISDKFPRETVMYSDAESPGCESVWTWVFCAYSVGKADCLCLRTWGGVCPGLSI